jgi:hypothetical protein
MTKLMVAFRNWTNAPENNHRNAETGSVYYFMYKGW